MRASPWRECSVPETIQAERALGPAEHVDFRAGALVPTVDGCLGLWLRHMLANGFALGTARASHKSGLYASDLTARRDPRRSCCLAQSREFHPVTLHGAHGLCLAKASLPERLESYWPGSGCGLQLH